MRLKTKLRALSFATSAILSLVSIANLEQRNVYADVNSQEILITEVMPTAQSSNDSYEYIELYNSTDRNIDLKDYKLPQQNVDITASKVIGPKGIFVICTKGTTTLQDFNLFYGSALTADKYMTLPFVGEVFSNNSSGSVVLAKDDGTVVSRAQYNTTDFELKKGINYKFSNNSFDMIILGQKQSPSPGTVSSEQIPQTGTRVTGVTIDKSYVTMEINQKQTLYANVSPITAVNKSVYWSSNNTSIVEINQEGVITAKAEGAANITVTTYDGGFTANCLVVVRKVAVTGVTLDKSSTTVEIGKAIVLRATIAPENATNKSVNWQSSNSNIAAVDNSGVVVAKKEGEVVITAVSVDGNYTASCRVRVNAVSVTVPVTSVSLDKTNITLRSREAIVLEAKILPTNATNKSVTWKSSDEGIVVVGNDGVIFGKAPGTALVIARTVDGGYLAYSAITVVKGENNNVTVTGVKLNNFYVQLNKGQTKSLVATVTPSNAANKAITWSSDNQAVATVDNSGKITAINKGIAIITVTTNDGNFKDRCLVLVNDTNPTSQVKLCLKLNKSFISIKEGKFEKLTAIITPANIKNTALVWKSDNDKVAYVDQSGKVVGKKEGTTTITVSTKDGKYSAKCKVVVTKNKVHGKGKGKSK